MLITKLDIQINIFSLFIASSNLSRSACITERYKSLFSTASSYKAVVIYLWSCFQDVRANLKQLIARFFANLLICLFFLAIVQSFLIILYSLFTIKLLINFSQNCTIVFIAFFTLLRSLAAHYAMFFAFLKFIFYCSLLSYNAFFFTKL